MHEQALLDDLVRKVEDVARIERLERITRVRVWVGALSHLSCSHLNSEWPRASRGTRAEGSTLETELSTDLDDPRAQSVVLLSLSVDEGLPTSGSVQGPVTTAPQLAGTNDELQSTRD
jgi:hydrogenase nickel incorporation protein HypA/HybF